MVTRKEAEEAVRTLIKWAGDDPSRQGLLETPRRVVDSYKEFFRGYHISIDDNLSKSFEKSEEFEDMVILKDIRVESYCEHHMLPIIGKATVAYIPTDRIIGLSKIARIVDMHSKRLQVQERMVIEIAETLDKIISPRGVGVLIEASHQCMTTRGIHKTESVMRTTHMTGCFKDKDVRREFLKSS